MYVFSAELWQYDGPGAWYFLSLPPDIADDIRAEFGAQAAGFGSIKVEATVRSTQWTTSLFPDKARGGPICFRSRNRCGRRRISKLATWQRSASGSDCDERLGVLFGNWLARAYLLLVAVVAVLVFVILEVGGEDANLAGVWLILVPLPGSLLASPVAGLVSGRLSTVIFFCALAISALINAAVISFLVHAVSRLLRSRA